MNTTLYIIIDLSGSMNEMGKIHLQRNLCRYAVQLQIINPNRYSNIETHIFQWAKSFSKIKIQDDGDIPFLTPEGASDLFILSDFLSQLVNEKKKPRVIILSDGNFINSEVLTFQNKLVACPNLLLRTVAVGADANLSNLKKMSSNNSVFFPEDISTAIDSTIFGVDEVADAPKSIDQFPQINMAKEEEDWDV